MLGIATSLLWAPCAGPVLGLILTGAALNGANVGTSLLLLAYAAGAATSLALAILVGGRVFAAMKRSLAAVVSYGVPHPGPSVSVGRAGPEYTGGMLFITRGYHRASESCCTTSRLVQERKASAVTPRYRPRPGGHLDEKQANRGSDPCRVMSQKPSCSSRYRAPGESCRCISTNFPRRRERHVPGFVYQLGNLLASSNATLQAGLAARFGGDYGIALVVVAGTVAVLIAILTAFGREARGVPFTKASRSLAAA